MEQRSVQQVGLFQEIRDFFTKGSNQRLPLVNYLLYGFHAIALLLLVVSTANLAIALYQYIRDYFNAEDYHFWEIIIGDGLLPLFIISICFLICNTLILRWKKKGLPLFIILSGIFLFPFTFPFFTYYILYSISLAVFTVVYYCTLRIPNQKGLSTWALCDPFSGRMKKYAKAIVYLWAFIILLIPPIIAFNEGFGNSYYQNGILCIDAKFLGANHSLRLANKMAFESHHKGDFSNIDYWYNNAINDCKRERLSIKFVKSNHGPWKMALKTKHIKNHSKSNMKLLSECYMHYTAFLILSERYDEAQKVFTEAKQEIYVSPLNFMLSESWKPFVRYIKELSSHNLIEEKSREIVMEYFNLYDQQEEVDSSSAMAKVPNISINNDWIEDSVVLNNKNGFNIHLEFSAYNLKDKTGKIVVFILDTIGNRIKNPDCHFCNTKSEVCISSLFTPSNDSIYYNDYSIFIPIEDIHTGKGHNKYICDINIYNSTEDTLLHENQSLSYYYTAPIKEITPTKEVQASTPIKKKASNKPVQEPKKKSSYVDYQYVKCRYCGGSGMCPACSLRATFATDPYIASVYAQYPCSDCIFRPGFCKKCEGSGMIEEGIIREKDQMTIISGKDIMVARGGADGVIVSGSNGKATAYTKHSSRDYVTDLNPPCSTCGGQRYEKRSHEYAAASTSGAMPPYHHSGGSSCPYCNKKDEHYHYPCPSCMGHGHE